MKREYVVTNLTKIKRMIKEYYLLQILINKIDKLAKLTQKEMENLSRPAKSKRFNS
jgi:hypothetical protein